MSPDRVSQAEGEQEEHLIHRGWKILQKKFQALILCNACAFYISL